MTVAMPFLQKLITFLWPPDIKRGDCFSHSQHGNIVVNHIALVGVGVGHVGVAVKPVDDKTGTADLQNRQLGVQSLDRMPRNSQPAIIIGGTDGLSLAVAYIHCLWLPAQ